MSFTSSNTTSNGGKALINPQRMQLAEQWRQDWVVNAEEGTTVDDVLNPVYWSSVAAQFQVFDQIDVRLETGEWILKLIVMKVERTRAIVYLAERHDLKELKDPDVPHDRPSEFEIAWRGIQRKFCVKRIADDTYVQEHLLTKEAAQTWLDSHEKAMQL